MPTIRVYSSGTRIQPQRCRYAIRAVYERTRVFTRHRCSPCHERAVKTAEVCLIQHITIMFNLNCADVDASTPRTNASTFRSAPDRPATRRLRASTTTAASSSREFANNLRDVELQKHPPVPPYRSTMITWRQAAHCPPTPRIPRQAVLTQQNFVTAPQWQTI